MERRSIGKFIAVLRKAAGMTQKELSEKLNVSDKAVSRWEREESLPDLTLLPVLAEIFGVTTDELLRGERIPAGAVTEKPPAKTKKQLERVLYASRTRQISLSMIAVGLTAVGLLGAMLCNLGLNRAYIGFCVGTFFYVLAVLCAVVLCIQALGAVEGDEFDPTALNHYRRGALKIAAGAMTLTLACFGGTVPLLVLPWDGYEGVEGMSWLGYGLGYGALALMICLVLWWIGDKIALKFGVYALSEGQKKCRKLRDRVIFCTVAVMVVTFAGELIFVSEVSETAFVSGTVFENYDSFIQFMETEKENNWHGGDEGNEVLIDDSIEDNGLTEEEKEALNYEELLASDGETVVCAFHWRNQEITRLTYGDKDTLLPITAYTWEDIWLGKQQKNFIEHVWLVLYLAEALTGIVYYQKKRH